MTTTVSALACAALLLPMVTALGCAADAPGKVHPYNVLDYPVAVTADPSGKTLWITSGNFDLEFGGGAVVALDLDTHEFIPGAAIEVGAFGSAMALLTDDEGKAVHGYVVSRAEDGLYHADIGEAGAGGHPTLTCIDDDDGEGDIIQVTAGGTLTSLRCLGTELTSGTVVDTFDTGSEAELFIGDDPFAAFVRKGALPGEPDLLLTGSMITGNLATWELDADGTPSLVGNVDLPDGLFAITDSPITHRVYAASKADPRIYVFKVDVPGPYDDRDFRNPYLVTERTITIPSTVVNDHVRDMAVSADGSLLVTSHRSPNTVVVIDVSEDVEGTVNGRVLAKIPVGSRPGDVALVPGSVGGAELAYVACFGSDRVDVVDPRAGEVVGRIPVGRGPYSLAYVPSKKRLYLTHFYSHSVGVIELDPTSPYYHQQIAEITGGTR